MYSRGETMNEQGVNPISVFTKYPVYHFMRSRWFYPVYDGVWLCLLILALALIEVTGFEGLVSSFQALKPIHLLAIIPLTYVLILGNVFAHNAAHRNFPRAINRLVGEIAGLLVLTRYASWELIHLRHHRYSDDPERDPHNCKNGFWLHFLPYFLVNVERQLKQNFYDYHGGPTPQNVRSERLRAVLSFGTSMLLIVLYAKLLGLAAFLCIFVPAQLITIVHLAHFNWATHNGFSQEQDFRPINLDRGFYWIGNRIFFGIYYHDNHHQMVKAFNPMFCSAELEARARRRELHHSRRPVKESLRATA
jgi:stearoyl-CoA desaturase (delta-9 desaturase)